MTPKLNPIVHAIRTSTWPSARPRSPEPETPAETRPSPDLDAAINAARAGDFGRAREIVAAAGFSERDTARVERAIQIKAGQDEELHASAQRFIAAGELSGMSPEQAAARLGCSAKRLANIESGQTTVTPKLILSASMTYGVSCDFLHGISNYPEREARTVEQIAIMAATRGTLKTALEEIAKAVIRDTGEAETAQACLNNHLDAIDDLTRAVESVERMSSSNLRGLSRLTQAVRQLRRVADQAGHLLGAPQSRTGTFRKLFEETA